MMDFGDEWTENVDKCIMENSEKITSSRYGHTTISYQASTSSNYEVDSKESFFDPQNLNNFEWRVGQESWSSG